ncbi:MAG: septal ring lytic transglycosylase RlpA family protein [Thermodesulfobacteriota bacterium]|nr:septal ring lytic transglycosylase RlpA family protein [Thermodesulfobacteriota bacterium]
MKIIKRFILPLFIAIAFSVFSCSVIKKEARHGKTYMVLPEIRGGVSRPYSVNGEIYYPLLSKEGFVQKGLASWYGKKFHGKKTANGEAYNMHDKTAAHKVLPFGTYVRVKNLANSRETVVRINDRGPFVKGRIIDLSFASAKKLGIVGSGVEKVRLVVLSKMVGKKKTDNKYRPLIEVGDYKKGRFAIQVGAFENRKNSERLADKLSVNFDHITITPYTPYEGKTLYRVRVSLLSNLIEANTLVKKLESLGFANSFIVAL